jgi:hypothetical protein
LGTLCTGIADVDRSDLEVDQRCWAMCSHARDVSAMIVSVRPTPPCRGCSRLVLRKGELLALSEKTYQDQHHDRAGSAVGEATPACQESLS